MTGLFGSLGTATRGMTANQAALQTSSHNIANTNTDGYSRQRVNLQAEASYHLAGVGSIGMGVKSAVSNGSSMILSLDKYAMPILPIHITNKKQTY